MPLQENDTITYTILAFRYANELDAFLVAATQACEKAIQFRRLSSNVLLVARDSHITPEEWGAFRGMGFRRVFGAGWHTTWHETLSLQNDRVSELVVRDIPFAEEFYGGEARVITGAGHEID